MASNPLATHSTLHPAQDKASHDQIVEWAYHRDELWDEVYRTDELDEQTKALVEGHLAGCPTCPPPYASLVGVRAHLDGLRGPDSVVDVALAERVRERL